MALTEADFKELEKMDREANTRLKESEVVRHLLPHLIHDPENPNKNATELYIAAAGSATRMIDVVADNDPNKVLYTIPPLVAQTPMVIRGADTNPDTDISAIMAQFEAEVTVSHPGAVIDNFVARMANLNHSPTEAISMVYGLMWARIYKRYNIPLERLFGENAEEAARMLGMSADADTEQVKGNPLNDLDPDEDFDPI